MDCDHCVTTVTNAAQELPGVEDVKVSLADKQAEIRFDAAKVNEQQIRAAIEEAGYPPAQ
ncbi:MAG: heavy metal transporter [Candidatus Chloroheliales bacterium]|nr:MAG: heavy metal transporter [Chloroflexota bacterium]